MRSFTQGNLRAGFNAVRNAKMRSFWTMLGVIIGVASVITIVSIGEGVKQQVSGQIHKFGSNLITIRPAQLQTSNATGNSGLNALSGLNISAPLTPKDISAVSKSKGVAASAPLTIASGSISSASGPYKDGFVIGTNKALPGLMNQSLAYGAFFSDDEENTAVLGQHAADKMFNVDVPLGHSFKFHGETFIVRGIFNQFNSTPLSQQADFNNAIFIPNDVAEKLNNNTAPTYTILARASKEADTAQVAATLRQALNKSRGSSDSFEVLTGNQNISASDDIVNLLTRLIAGVAAISLFVGGVGIMNVMLVSVAERTHEIGIRKAVGATNRQILNQFVVESTVLSLTGGVIGIILALLIDVTLRLTTNLKPVISWEIIVIATGVSLLAGIIFGTVPAVKAARKDPIDALRSE